jgi:KN17 SH3-like C-terminal domain
MSKELKEHGYYKKKGFVRRLVSKYVGEIVMLDSDDVLQVGRASCGGWPHLPWTSPAWRWSTASSVSCCRGLGACDADCLSVKGGGHGFCLPAR